MADNNCDRCLMTGESALYLDEDGDGFGTDSTAIETKRLGMSQ